MERNSTMKIETETRSKRNEIFIDNNFWQKSRLKSWERFAENWNKKKIHISFFSPFVFFPFPFSIFLNFPNILVRIIFTTTKKKKRKRKSKQKIFNYYINTNKVTFKKKSYYYYLARSPNRSREQQQAWEKEGLVKKKKKERKGRSEREEGLNIKIHQGSWYGFTYGSVFPVRW